MTVKLSLVISDPVEMLQNHVKVVQQWKKSGANLHQCCVNELVD